MYHKGQKQEFISDQDLDDLNEFYDIDSLDEFEDIQDVIHEHFEEILGYK